MSAEGPGFDEPVVANGYRWWYVDALSDDQQFGLTIIAFIGCVFSPYYAWARRRGEANPQSHCSVNAILYGPRSKHWALTERGEADLQRGRDFMRVGPSALRYEGDSLVIDINEITVPWPRRLSGQVRLFPQALNAATFQLDGQGRHHWRPVAPVSRVEVEFQHPALTWRGEAYFDANWGTEPLEAGFTSWNWSRARLGDDSTVVLYEPVTRDGKSTLLSSQFFSDGSRSDFPAGAASALPATPLWRVARSTRAQAGNTPRVKKTLEDTPFYARSLLEAELMGQSALVVHEGLDLDRFRRRWVQGLLPFRMPRRPIKS